MPIFVTAATFFVVATLVLAVGRALPAESPVAERVRQLVAHPTHTVQAAASGGTRLGPLGRLLAAIGNGLGGDRSISHRLAVAGLRGANATALFLGARTLMSVGPALLVLVPAVSSGRPIDRALMTAALYWAGGHMLANLWLKRRARKRVLQITKALPDALDLMVVCLEAGLGLNATIQKVGDERATVADVLGDEFAQVT